MVMGTSKKSMQYTPPCTPLTRYHCNANALTVLKAVDPEMREEQPLVLRHSTNNKFRNGQKAALICQGPTPYLFTYYLHSAKISEHLRQVIILPGALPCHVLHVRKSRRQEELLAKELINMGTEKLTRSVKCVLHTKLRYKTIWKHMSSAF